MMGPTMIDFSKPCESTSPLDLSVYLAQLVGEPFRFARVSYGDELNLHFGDLRPASSPLLKDKLFGVYILGMRGSSWILKSESVLVADLESSPEFGFMNRPEPLRKDELESGQFIKPESLVVAATPFVVRPVNGFGLQLRMSDGSGLLVLPTVPEPDGPEDANLPQLADWHLLSPHGLLRADHGPKWSFEPKMRHK